MPQNHQIEMSTHEVQSLNENLKALQKQFDVFASTQDNMVTLLSGNELDPNDTGMIGRLQKVEQNQQKIQKGVWLALGGFAVIIFIIKYVWH